MADTVTINTVLPARPEIIYQIWLNSRQHSDFTGSPATIDAREGGEFSAWNGYISGRNRVLVPGQRIVQTWRTTDFPADAPDSELEMLLESFTGGTVFTLIHRNLPEDQIEDYRNGWEEHYLLPLKEYLEDYLDAENLH